MNILKPEHSKSLEDAFFEKVSGPEHDRAIACIILLKLQGYSANSTIEQKLDLLAKLHGLSELLDIKRILSAAPTESSQLSDDDLLRKIAEFEQSAE